MSRSPADPSPNSRPDRVADPGGDDGVLTRRDRIRRVTRVAKRIGYASLLVAIVAFGVALATGLDRAAVTVTVIALIAACVVLPVPIVLGYGIRAAEREEREERARRAAP